MSYEQKLRDLIDKQEIHEVLARYCRGVDRNDRDMIRSVYHEDSVDDHGIWKGRGVDFADWIVEALKDAGHCMHVLGTVLIELDGDTAHCETYCIATSDDGRNRATVLNRYIDRFEKRNDEWKIASRLVVFDLGEIENSRIHTLSALGNALTWGRRDKGDAVYRPG